MAPYPPRRLVFLHRPGLCRPGVSPFESSVCWSCRRVDGCGILKWEVILPGRRWLHLFQPISDEPLGLGFPHRAGRYQPGRPPFPSSVCFRCVEAFRILIWHLILPGFRWLYEPPPISHRPVGLGFPRCDAANDPGDHRFRLHLVGFLLMRGSTSDPEMVNNLPRVRRNSLSPTIHGSSS